MKIKPVKTAETYVSRINVLGKVDDYVNEMLNKSNADIETLAESYNKFIKIAQRKEGKVNALYINSGNITSRIDLNKLNRGSDIYSGIVENIRANTGKNLSKLI